MALNPRSTLLRLLHLAAENIRSGADPPLGEIARELFPLIACVVPVSSWYNDAQARADLWDLLCHLHPGVDRADLEPPDFLRPAVMRLLGDAAEQEAYRRASLPLDQGGMLVSLSSEFELFGRPLPCQFIVAVDCGQLQLQLWSQTHIHISPLDMSLATFGGSSIDVRHLNHILAAVDSGVSATRVAWGHIHPMAAQWQAAPRLLSTRVPVVPAVCRGSASVHPSRCALHPAAPLCLSAEPGGTRSPVPAGQPQRRGGPCGC